MTKTLELNVYMQIQYFCADYMSRCRFNISVQITCLYADSIFRCRLHVSMQIQYFCADYISRCRLNVYIQTPKDIQSFETILYHRIIIAEFISSIKKYS